MTANQVAWYRAVEEARANRAREDEALRANQAQELEKFRHHTAKESMGWYSAEEQARANVARESILQAQLDEDIRAHKAREFQKAEELYENSRANRAKEFNAAQIANLRRAEVLNTSLANWQRYATASAQQELERARLREEARSNLARENLQRLRINQDYAAKRAEVAERRKKRYSDFYTDILRSGTSAVKLGLKLFGVQGV